MSLIQVGNSTCQGPLPPAPNCKNTRARGRRLHCYFVQQHEPLRYLESGPIKIEVGTRRQDVNVMKRTQKLVCTKTVSLEHTHISKTRPRVDAHTG